MKREPSPSLSDPLAKPLRDAFPDEPVPQGLAARIVAAAENPQPSRRRDALLPWPGDRRRALATALSATACGLILGISLGLGAFGGSGNVQNGGVDCSPTYLAHLSGYTDVEDLRP